MGCSDTWADVLSQRDPQFLERNDWNDAADRAERYNMLQMCRMGVEAYEGRLASVESLRRITYPRDNPYLDEYDKLCQQIGYPRGMPQHEYVNRIADAADSLREWVAKGNGGRLAFEWLVEHWQMDLERLDITNERHKRELTRLPPSSPKAVKRVERLAEEVPEAEEVRRRLEWARGMLA